MIHVEKLLLGQWFRERIKPEPLRITDNYTTTADFVKQEMARHGYLLDTRFVKCILGIVQAVDS